MVDGLWALGFRPHILWIEAELLFEDKETSQFRWFLLTACWEDGNSLLVEAAIMGGTYQDLRVWQSAMELTVNIYRATRKFPAEEMYGLSSQLWRAAVSVASNIAEGKGRSSDKELLQFLSHARGSIYEVQL